MKPVEIEFLMKDNLSGGLDKAGLAVDILQVKAEKAATAIRQKIVDQQKIIEQVTSDLNRMEAQLSGMKPGTAQEELATEVAACRKVLEEERTALQGLEKEHAQAEKAVQGLRKEYEKIAVSEEQTSVQSQSLTDKIREQKEVIKQVEADVKALEKAYKNAAPGNAKLAALDELNAAKKALEEDKNILASYQAEQERTQQSTKRLSLQLREMQDVMARMRLNGQQNTEEYRKMAAEAANLSDTLADLNTQTKILSNDDANLQGFMSGASGLAGVFTTATGALSLFASENENLAKIQTRVQSVMAITMGLQQVFNTLNKDSAFRLVTVVKMKNLLTAANTRLATSLGISTVAAQALMATLTLGLSVVITGLIVAWDKYSDAQEKAAEKAKERVEIESEGRAQMIKTRFEIESTLTSLKEFAGSKEEEKAKVEELNRKYGESFGYYDTIAEWYDILTKKSEDYIQMLFLQAKAQKLVNKAVEADDEVNKLKATDAKDVEGAHGGFYRFFAKLGAHNVGMTPAEMDAEIDKENDQNKEAKIKSAQEKVDEYLKQAEELTKQATDIGKKSSIGGHVKPKKKDTEEERKKQLALEKQREAEYNKLRQANQQAEVNLLKEGGEKKRRQIQLNYEKEIAEIAAQEKKWRDAQKGNLTGEQETEIDKAKKMAADKRDKGLADTTKEELEASREAMREYLKEYGTYMQQKHAIAEEYAEKIRKAQEEGNTGEVIHLQKQQQQETAAAETASVKADIDWVGLFGNFGGLLEEQLKPTLEKLKKYAASDEFKGASLEDKQLISELISKLEERTSGGINSKMFSNVAKDMADYQSSLRALIEAKEEERKKEEELTKAQEALKKATESGDQAAIKQAEETVSAAQEAFDAASESVGTLTDANNQAAQNLRTSSSNAVNSLTDLAAGLQGLKSGSLVGVAQGLGKLGEATKNMGGVMGNVGSTLAETFSNGGIIGQIIAAVLSVLDVLKEGVGYIVSSLIDSILGAVNGILENILSGKLFSQIGISLFTGVRSILDTVTFGLFSSHGNAKEVNKLVDRLTESNKYLTTAIEKLTDEMENSGGVQSTEYYRSAYEKQRQKIENDREMLMAKMGYHSSHHSNNYYIGKAMGSSDWDTVSSYLGKSVRDTGALWNLSPEELAKLQELPDIWEKLHSGKYDQSEWLDEYISDANTLIELQQQWQDAITDTSFDSIKSGMKSLLKDFKTDTEDVISSVDEFLENAILKSIVDGTYSDEIKKWQEVFAEFMSDGILSKDEAETLRNRYKNIFEQAQAEKDAMFDAAGITEDSKTTSQSGKSGSYTVMSQDQGTKLEGMFTSGLNHWVSMDERMEDVADKMGRAENHLAKIEENTGDCKSSLKAIAEDTKKILRDGVKLRS